MNLPKRYLGEHTLTWLTVVSLKHKTRIWKFEKPSTMMTILKTITISASRPTDDNALFIRSARYILSITLNVEAL